MKLTTARLILRDFKRGDEREVVRNLNNLNVSRYLAVVSYPYTMKDAREWVNICLKNQKKKPRNSYQLAVCMKNENKVIGGIGLGDVNFQRGTAEIGYWLSENHWRQGIMSEAMREMIRFAFENLKLRRIHLPAYVQNNASNGLAKKMGFVHEGKLRSDGKPVSTGKIHDTNLYGLLAKEWKKHKKTL